MKGEFAAARERTETAQAKFPHDWELNLLAAELEFFARRFDLAEVRYNELTARESAGKPLMSFSAPIRFKAALGFIRHIQGRISEGRQLLEEARALDLKDLKVAPENPRLLYSLAAEYAAGDETEPAIEYLSRAVQAGWIDHRSLSLDPRFDSIRADARYQALVLQLTETMRRMQAAATQYAAGASN